MTKRKPMNKTDAARIRSAEAVKNEGKISKDSFASRAESAAAKATQERKER